MEKIWANRLINGNGSKTWADVPENRKAGVLAELDARLEAGKITKQQYNTILGIEEEPENTDGNESNTEE